MGKLIDLFDFEFNRNKRNYIIIISTFCLLLTTKLIMNLSSYNYIMNKIIKKSSNVESIGTFGFDNLITNSELRLFIIGIGVCLLYSFIIWNKDFVGKNKSIYMLYMLPQNKFNIYISKFLNIICLVYMFVVSFVVVLFLAYNIMPFMMKGNVENFGFARSIMETFFVVIPYSLNNFIYNYVIVLTNIISIVFMILLFSKYIKVYKFNHLLIILLMFIYIIFNLYKVYFLYIIARELNINICILTTVINIFTSYILLKKIEL